MKFHIHLLQTNLQLGDFKFALLCLVTAFIVTLLAIPPRWFILLKDINCLISPVTAKNIQCLYPQWEVWQLLQVCVQHF